MISINCIMTKSLGTRIIPLVFHSIFVLIFLIHIQIIFFSKDWANFSNASMPTPGRTPSFPPNLFSQAPRHAYSPLVYPQLQGYPYQGMPFPDPAAAMAMSMYPAAAAAAAYNPMNPLYRSGLEQQPLTSMQQMSESLLQQGLYGQKFGEYTQNPPMQQMTQMQNIDITRNDPKLK